MSRRYRFASVLQLREILNNFTIIITMSRAGDLTIEGIIKKYEHRQQALKEDLKQTDSIDTARPRGDPIMASGASTPEFSHTVNRKEINRKLEDEERIQRTQKKEERREEASFSTERDLQAVLLQLGEAEERLARSERNFAEASRRCEQLQRREREAELQGRLRDHSTGEREGRVAVLQRECLNYRECLASKDSNLEILRLKLKEKNEKLIESERMAGELRSQLAATVAAGEKAQDQEQGREREKEQLVGRLKAELATLQAIAGEGEAGQKQLLAEVERGYRMHQEELQVVRQSYLQVEEEYKQWIDGCNAEKLALITEYEQKLAAARTAPPKPQSAFEEELERRERESGRLIALTARQAGQVKQLRGEVEAAERAKSQLVLKVSALENALLDKGEMLSSLQTAYAALQTQYKQEEERSRELRERYNSVNREFVELRGRCGALFESLEANRREGQGEGAELVRVRKELLLCRENLERSRANETALTSKLAEATRAVKDRLSRLQQEREESLTELLAERLQNARLQQELQETRQYLKREYELSVENTRKELERQIGVNSKTSRSSDPEKEQLYLQLRALERKYELLAQEIVTVDEVMGIASKVKRRHEPLKKSRLQPSC